ncbi:MAG TPA: polyphosphate kinase 2 family protein, partial [Humisphaera sp.]|nr:polyphosphate kinase 2 family protein [Humisphaera sp.]
MIDSPYLAEPGKKFRISDHKADDTGDFKDKRSAEEDIRENLAKLIALQDKLYASAKHSVLIVLQAMDGGGKDGAINHVFSGVNPQGCNVTSFKQPSTLELAHDYLWRIHAATPKK